MDKTTSIEPASSGYACAHCKDTRQAEPDCCECEGAGWVNDPDDGGTMTCPECNNEKCAECGD